MKIHVSDTVEFTASLSAAISSQLMSIRMFITMIHYLYLSGTSLDSAFASTVISGRAWNFTVSVAFGLKATSRPPQRRWVARLITCSGREESGTL